MAKNLRDIYTDLIQTGILDERILEKLERNPEFTGVVDWVGRKAVDKATFYYMPVISLLNGQATFHGTTAAVVKNLPQARYAEYGIFKLEQDIDRYVNHNLLLPTSIGMEKDQRYGLPLKRQFDELYKRDQQAFFHYWAIYCIGKPPLGNAQLVEYDRYKDKHIQFVRFDKSDRVKLDQMYNLMAYPDCPRPYFNPRLNDGQGLWQIVDFKNKATTELPKVVQYSDYDLNNCLIQLDLFGCGRMDHRYSVEKMLRSGRDAKTHHQSSTTSDYLYIVASPSSKDIIVLNGQGQQVDKQPYLAPQYVVDRRVREYNALLKQRQAREVKPPITGINRAPKH